MDQKYIDGYGNFSTIGYFVTMYNCPPKAFYATRCRVGLYQEFLEKYKDQTSCVYSYRFAGTEYIADSSTTHHLPNLNCVVKFENNAKHGQDSKLGEMDLSTLVYYRDVTLCQELLDLINSNYYVPDPIKNNPIRLVVVENNALTTKEFNIKINDIDVGLHYGKKFVPVYEKIYNQLNENNNKGLVLLHGKPGTGKTSLIKYIAKYLEREVLFIPPGLGESLSDPKFLPFLINHANSVLVIEDAEKIINDREGKGYISPGISNILNISDGILGDCLNIQIIATFNTKKDTIDQALLRKGRLIAEHEFGSLDVNDSNDLLKHLGKNHVTSVPMTLTDIYNLEESEYRSQKERTAVGFKI